MSERLNSPHAAWLAAKLNEEAITLLKNEGDIIPLKQLDKKKIAALSIGDGVGNEFQKMLGRYDSVACFSISRNATAAQVQSVYKNWRNTMWSCYGVHTVRIPESPALRELAAKKELDLCLFHLALFL